jgi:hypothetical protein
MPVLNSEGDWSLEDLVTMHGLSTVKDKQFAIEGIAIDLGITTEEAFELLVAEGYLTSSQK